MLVTARDYHTMTLLPNGQILATAGGEDSRFGPIASAEIYNVGLGFNSSWQPQLTAPTSVSLNSALTLSGTRFRGISGGSYCGNAQDSSADYPVLQLRSLQTDQIIFV